MLCHPLQQLRPLDRQIQSAATRAAACTKSLSVLTERSSPPVPTLFPDQDDPTPSQSSRPIRNNTKLRQSRMIQKLTRPFRKQVSLLQSERAMLCVHWKINILAIQQKRGVHPKDDPKYMGSAYLTHVKSKISRSLFLTTILVSNPWL